MKLIKPSYKILNQSPGLQGIYEQIELAGRTCYASTHKIQYQENDTCNGSISTTAKDFVDRMIASHHYAMLEHGTVYLTVPYNSIIEYADSQNPFYRDILCNPWIKYVIDYENDVVYISSNYRWIIENNLENWLQYLCEPTEFHEKRVTVRFVTSNGIAREFTRHRVFSFAQESTRYCNYTNQTKFGNELTYIHNSDEINIEQKDVYERIERCYKNLIANGMKPQMARDILPLALKTELVMTGFVSDWDYFFDLRARGTTGQPHPDAKALAEPLMHEFINRNYLDYHINN